MKKDPYKKPIWIKYECEHGARWTAVKGGTCETEAGRCNFSGCSDDHDYRIVAETTDRAEAHQWFRRPHQHLHKWAEDNLSGKIVHVIDDFDALYSDKTAASWGCDNPVIDGYTFAWITLSPQKAKDKQTTYYDFKKIA